MRTSGTLPGIYRVWSSLRTDVHKHCSWACCRNYVLHVLIVLLRFFIPLLLWFPSSWSWLWLSWWIDTWGGCWWWVGWGRRDWRRRWGRRGGRWGWHRPRRRWRSLVCLHFTVQTLLGLMMHRSYQDFWDFLCCVVQTFLQGGGLLLRSYVDVILKFKELTVVVSQTDVQGLRSKLTHGCRTL